MVNPSLRVLCWSRIRHAIRFFFLYLTTEKILCLSVALLICSLLVLLTVKAERAESQSVRNPQRIISLAPAITETLFMLGLGDKVAGVTQFCAWPPEAAQKAKMGGFREVNIEAIARTGADLVLLPSDMSHFRKAIEDLGIAVRLFDYHSLSGFIQDIQALGKLCGHECEAAKLVAAFSAVSITKEEKKKPSVLFALLNPDEYQNPVGEMTIIGANAFYHDIINAAGGHNAYTGSIPFPRISLEAVLALDPDVIVIGAPDVDDIDAIAKKWREIGQLKGMQGKRLLILNDPADTVPGPRSLETIRKLAEAVNAAKEGD